MRQMGNIKKWISVVGSEAEPKGDGDLWSNHTDIDGS